MKFTRTHEKQLREFFEKMNANWIVPVSDWTSGKGRFTTNRALPPFVIRFERKEYAATSLPKHGTAERAAYEWFTANPRRKACLALDRIAFAEFMFESMRGKEI